MINPFAGKANMLEQQPSLLDALIDEDETPVVVVEEARPTAWQQVLGIVFGEGVASLPVTAAPDERVSKRRARRLRGRAKATRRAA